MMSRRALLLFPLAVLFRPRKRLRFQVPVMDPDGLRRAFRGRMYTAFVDAGEEQKLWGPFPPTQVDCSDIVASDIRARKLTEEAFRKVTAVIDALEWRPI